MPDLPAILQITATTAGKAGPGVLRAVPIALPGTAQITGDFSEALSQLLIPTLSVGAKGERQAPAGSGKDLPVAPDEQDATLTWLPEGLVPVALPAIVEIGADTPARSAASVSPGQPLLPTAQPAPGLPLALPTSDTAPPAPTLPQAQPTLPPVAGFAVSPVTLPGVAMPGNVTVQVAFGTDAAAADKGEPGQPLTTATNDLPADTALATPCARFERAVLLADTRLPAPALIPLQPAPVVRQTVTHGVASQVFATTIIGTSADPTPLDRIGETAMLLHTQHQVEQRTTVQAMSATAQSALDLTQDSWMPQMIDRIAALRDAAEAADTRIKLAPENLGALEVSIRRDGDRLHIHFSAENPAARQLIADAAPRLAELADARGLKLGQTSVDGGSAGNGQQQARRDQQQPATPLRNTMIAAAEPAGDDRIA